MEGHESRWHSRTFHGWMGGVDVASGSHQWRITSFGGGDRTAEGVHPGTSRSAGVPSRTWPRGGEQARDRRRSPGPPGGHAATETDHRQPRQPTSEVPETNGSNLSGTNQLVLESIDTVGVRSSILRSPTPEPPRIWGVQSFPDHRGAAVGPRGRWLALDRHDSGVAPVGPSRFLRLARRVAGEWLRSVCAAVLCHR
jgi:hypothetical protein